MDNYTPDNIRAVGTKVHSGCYLNVPFEDYLNAVGMSKSKICDINESVATMLWKEEHPQKQTDAMLKGSALHDRVLLPDLYEYQYVKGPTNDKRTKKWHSFVSSVAPRTVLTPKMEEDVACMSSALWDNEYIRSIVTAPTTWREVSCWAHHHEFQVMCKFRPDIIVDNWIYDIKTTNAPQWRPFRHTVFAFHYHVQAAFYVDMANSLGLDIEGFRFLVVGSKPPYDTAVYELDMDLMEEGREFYRSGLKAYSDYLTSSDRYAGLPYGRDVVTIPMNTDPWIEITEEQRN